MSVYKRPGETTYSYRFQYRGRRFSGQTDKGNRREAEAYEADIRRQAETSVQPIAAPLTVTTAASRYWNEHGKHLKMAGDLFRYFGWLERHLGKGKRLAAITDSEVAHLVATRRADRVSNATVNRSVIEPLRMICKRAELVWKLPAPAIDWKRHRMAEAQEVVREASVVEETALFATIRPDYAPVLAFALVSGCRLSEIVELTWPQVEWFADQMKITGKGDRTRTIPITAAMGEILKSVHGHDPLHVFTYEAMKTRDGRVKGERYPITKSGLKTTWRRMRAASGVKGLRFHDLRHTAATRLLRSTGNLRLAQMLLGHSDISTTQRYAHVQMDDLRAGMERAATRSGTESGAEAKTARDARKAKGYNDE
ncbi:site-specific integrase [Ahrensia sp. R2A130]|uniref:tyrosine-type recombinase/integrase n=1 Tax=Ahrensia sp. R2A130 TaxID=744979 RepID=UPI0001E0BCD5|nr:site-specific integrase [Ahrensia sp. R2A130]EFL88349.1 site-specific integrase/recombinase [Ahrensia sp. R2A130]